MKTNLRAFAMLAMTITTIAQPCLSADFSLAVSYGIGGNNTPIWLSLDAIAGGSNGTLHLAAERLSRYPGSPVSLSGMSGNASLTVHIDGPNSDCHTIPDGDYGIFVPDLGELYGYAFPVLATLGQKWPHFFYATNGEIDPQQTSGSQLWFLCDEYIDGLNYLALSWGIYANNGSAPTGCLPTSVKQVYNIPCGDA